MKYVKGTDMSTRLQREAKACFVHRFTGDHKPLWARKPMPDGSAYPRQFANDQDWLANTVFAVRNDGELAKREACISSPTWPNNPELRTRSANKAA